jgi:zinc transport system ATP-binding protein
MDTISAISIHHLYVEYERNLALEDINLEVKPKDYLGIIGPNGGGKSTLLKSLLGLVKPSKGKVLIFGKTPAQAHSHIGYVPQYTNFDRDFPIDVWNVVLMGRLGKPGLFRRCGSKDRKFAEAALAQVAMTPFRQRQIGRLSGGQLQRVLIARALASQPDILLLDEPTSSIDAESETGLYELLHKLNETMTIILVSHDIGAISRHVNSIACLNRKLYHHGSKDLTPEVIESVYGCPVDLIAHGTPHRVLDKHDHGLGDSHD